MDEDAAFSPLDESESSGGKRRWWLWIVVAATMLGLPCFVWCATIIVPETLGRFVHAQREKAKIDITWICQGIDTYTIENNGRYPQSLEDLVTPDEQGKTYLKGWTWTFLDPWMREYVYEPPSAGRPYRVMSYGADGVAGGTGPDADIDNLSMLAEMRR